tara:strand:- start:159 stop:911 length:753 start_codon:yes stop_codon:yes gene_type:complete
MINLNSEISQIDIKKNDTVLIHSNLLKLVRESGSREKGSLIIENFIDYLLEIIGINGTLIFPTFTFSFSNKGITSYKNKDCETGILCKKALLRNKGLRSYSPVYSFTSIGRLSRKINSFIDLKPFRENSIFNLLEKNNCKILLINLNDNDGLTYVHYVEAMLDVPYRKFKIFKGKIENKNNIEETYTELFVRNNNTIKTDISDLQNYLLKKNLYNVSENMRLISMQRYRRECLELLDLRKYEMFRKIKLI